MTRILYFARLRETLGRAAEDVELPADVRTLAELTAWLQRRGGAWADQLADPRAFRAAVNQELANPATPVGPGDEVAYFPPVTGG